MSSGTMSYLWFGIGIEKKVIQDMWGDSCSVLQVAWEINVSLIVTEMMAGCLLSVMLIANEKCWRQGEITLRTYNAQVINEWFWSL